MSLFVHITREAWLSRIQRGGVRRARGALGVYAVPVVANYFVTHQWLREMARWHVGPLAAVYFRVPDDEPVLVGRYNEPHRSLTAAEAATLFRDESSRLGWQVVVPRRIGADEIHRVRRLRQIVGWRYSPESHGSRPCACPRCQFGQYGGRRLRERLGRE